MRQHFKINPKRKLSCQNGGMKKHGPLDKCEAVLICLGAGLGAAGAQSVIMSAPQPPYSTVPPGMQQYETNQMQVFTPADTAPAMGEEKQPLKWKFITLHPHVYYNFVSSSGVEAAPGQQNRTVVQQVSPGMLFNLGDYWTLDYTPTLTYYSDSNFHDTLAHSVTLAGGKAYGDWLFNLSQGYASSDAPLVQTGGQTGQETYSTALSAIYQINSRLALSLGANQSLNYVDSSGAVTNAPSASRTWSTMDWLNYEFWPRLNAGAGAGLGYINEVGGTDMIYEQYQGQVNWRATDKISFQLSGGLEDEQFLGSSGAGDLVTPIFNAAIQYQPFDQTRLTLSASRSVSSSYYYVNQVSETTQVAAGLNQRLLGELYLDVGGGYARAKYVSSVPLAGVARADDYYTFNTSLTCPILKYGTLSVFYNYSHNASNQSGFLGPLSTSSAYAFSSSQVGFSVSLRY